MSSVEFASSVGATETFARVRVMLVDDSGVSRALMAQWLETDPKIKVVASARTGEEAIEFASKYDLDVVVLDVEMPGIGGIKALPKIVAAASGARILMASTLTTRNARITLEALELGATDAIAKPQAGWASASGPEFRTEFIRKVHELGAIRPKRAAGKINNPGRPIVSSPPAAAAIYPRAEPSHVRPSVLAIGASTGGPNALLELTAALPKPVNIPILITQHMPPMFTAILAEHIGRRSGLPTFEAVDHIIVEPGHIYVAPGGLHMEALRVGNQVRLRVSGAPPENFCRPSVNPMLRSAAEVWGKGTLGVMLSGMGTDGLAGAREVVAVGGTMLAQDQESSVVWGMPGAIVREGLAAEILSVSGLASAIGCLLEPVK